MSQSQSKAEQAEKLRVVRRRVLQMERMGVKKSPLHDQLKKLEKSSTSNQS
jgi:hypothetical protein